MDICLRNIPPGKIVHFNSVLSNKTIVFRDVVSPPFVYSDFAIICGPMIKIITELAIRKNYKYLKIFLIFMLNIKL